MKNKKFKKTMGETEKEDKQQSAKKQQPSDAPRQSHDTYFKAAFSDLEISRTVLMERLPQELVARCDWDTLRLESTHVQSRLLREKTADVIFSVKMKDCSDLKILYHLEHLSKPKRWVTLYCWNIIFEYLYKLREKEGVEKLPVMVPLIVYQNSKPFTYSTDICDLFDQPELAREHLLKPIKLYEVCQEFDEETSAEGKASLAQITMKYIYLSDFLRIVPHHFRRQLVWLMKNDKAGVLPFIMQTLCYIECKANISNKGEFATMIGEIDKELEAAMATMAQQYRQEGEQIGIKRGKLEGEQDMIGTMLQRGGKPAEIAKMTGMAIETIQKLAKAFFERDKKKETEEV